MNFFFHSKKCIYFASLRTEIFSSDPRLRIKDNHIAFPSRQPPILLYNNKNQLIIEFWHVSVYLSERILCIVPIYFVLCFFSASDFFIILVPIYLFFIPHLLRNVPIQKIVCVWVSIVHATI